MCWLYFSSRSELMGRGGQLPCWSASSSSSSSSFAEDRLLSRLPPPAHRAIQKMTGRQDGQIVGVSKRTRACHASGVVLAVLLNAVRVVGGVVGGVTYSCKRVSRSG